MPGHRRPPPSRPLIDSAGTLRLCRKAIKGQTGARLKLTRAMVGKRIKVKVTGSKPGHATTSLKSAATRPVRR